MNTFASSDAPGGYIDKWEENGQTKYKLPDGSVVGNAQAAPPATGQNNMGYNVGRGAANAYAEDEQRRQNDAAARAQAEAQYQQSLGFYTTVNAGQAAAMRGQYDAQQARIPLINASYGQQASGMTRESDLRRQLLGYDRGNIDIERGGLNRQIGYYGNVQGTKDRQTAAMLGYLDRDYRSGLGGLQVQRNQANLGAEQTTGNLNSDATARGAYTAAGTNTQRTDIQNNLAQQIAGINIEQEKLQTGTERSQSNLLFDQELGRMSTAEQQARLGDRQKTLDNEAAKLGVQGDILGAQLQQGLARLNLDQTMSVGQLMDAMSSNDAQQQALAAQIIQQAVGAAGYFPG
jgi:hypothetical protein